MFEEAIDRGIRQGFEDALIKRTGCDKNRDLCPFKKTGECVCYQRYYDNLYFWQKWKLPEPKRPSQDDVLTAVFEWAIDKKLMKKMASKT